MNDTLKTTAQALVAHCRHHTEAEGLKTLYAPDAVSVEAMEMPGSTGREAAGVEAIKGKHDWWEANFEVHDSSVGDPMYHGDDRFSVIFEMDVTEKETGSRCKSSEVAIYTINDAGKIVKEEFFYAAV